MLHKMIAGATLLALPLVTQLAAQGARAASQVRTNQSAEKEEEVPTEAEEARRRYGHWLSGGDAATVGIKPTQVENLQVRPADVPENAKLFTHGNRGVWHQDGIILKSVSAELTQPIRPSDRSPAERVLYRSKKLVCKFKEGSVVKWTKGKPIVELDVFSKSSDPTTFSSIDLKAGTAMMGGNVGSGPLDGVITTSSGVTFIELTQSGNVNITTVFTSFVEESRMFPAVHSRHVLMTPLIPGFGQAAALPSQYHGTCITTD